MRLGGVLAIAFVLAGCASGSKYQGVHPYGVFDAPLRVEIIKISKDPLNPQAVPHLACSRYPTFTVKEVDRGEKGAEKLSVIAADAKCAIDTPGEILISGQIEGYFKGVMGDYIFFDASDGWDGGVPFYVFDPKGKKLFEDSVVNGEIALASRDGKNLRLQFQRVFHAECSLYLDQEKCAQKTEEASHLGGEGAAPNLMLPDCRAVYDEELKKTEPKYADALKESPSVLIYPVELTFDGEGAPFIMPTGVTPAECRVPS